MSLDTPELPEAVVRLLQRRAPDAHALYRDSSDGGALLSACGIVLDFSRQRLDADGLAELRRLAVDRDVIGVHRSMAKGEVVNVTERRAALHTALRAPVDEAFGAPGSVVQAVHDELERLRTFAKDVRSGAWKGATGRPMADVINIGIGGSDSGPRLVCDALADVSDGPRAHFLSNVDGHAVARLLPRLDPATTLAIVSSKSLSTRETLLNAKAVQVLARSGGNARCGAGTPHGRGFSESGCGGEPRLAREQPVRPVGLGRRTVFGMGRDRPAGHAVHRFGEVR